MTQHSRWARRMHRIAMGAVALIGVTAAGPAPAHTILFVGNSFTFGAHSAVQAFHPERVTDLNGDGIGGVPALFATFARERGLDWTVSLETSPGKDLAWHLENKRAVFTRSWDVAILQGHSMLDVKRPGDPTRHIAAAKSLAMLLHAGNPKVTIDLVSTWSRADQTYRPGGAWAGKSITRMAEDLAAANARVLAEDKTIAAAIPVGTAWNRAFRTGVADPNPYDGVAFGQTDLWTYDQYHASAEGYYLEALVIFGKVTGTDPRLLGEQEEAARELGLDPRVTVKLQATAAAELGV